MYLVLSLWRTILVRTDIGEVEVPMIKPLAGVCPVYYDYEEALERADGDPARILELGVDE